MGKFSWVIGNTMFVKEKFKRAHTGIRLIVRKEVNLMNSYSVRQCERRTYKHASSVKRHTVDARVIRDEMDDAMDVSRIEDLIRFKVCVGIPLSERMSWLAY